MSAALRTSLGLAVVMIAGPMDGRHDLYASSRQYQAETLINESFTVRRDGTLRVDVPDADLDIRPGTAERAAVRVLVRARDPEWGREVFARMAFEVAPDEQGLSVRARSARIRDDEWRRHRSVSLRVEIDLPRQYNMDVVTRDGDVDAGDFTGRIDLRSQDGDLTLGTLRGPAISLETQDGDIRADSLGASEVRVYTQDGDIDIRAVSGSVRMSTSDGDIRVRLGSVADVTLRTGDGDITVYAESGLRAEIDFSGEDIHIDSFQLDGRLSSRGARGSINGGGPILTARTGDGTITLRRW